MKKLTKIHLHNLSQSELAKREENMLKGGYTCVCVSATYCSCAYAGPPPTSKDSFYGGSSEDANSDANFFDEVTRNNHG